MTTTKTIRWAPAERERRAALQMTGRYIVTVQHGSHREISSKLAERGMNSAASLPAGADNAKPLSCGQHLMLEKVGVAVVDPSAEQEGALRSLVEQESAVLAVEPERIVHAVSGPLSLDYIKGWRDGIEAFSTRLLREPQGAGVAMREQADAATWGLIATKVVASRYSGTGIKLAVLDTGLDLTHPDFVGRQVVTMNFVGDGTPFHDRVGHGTHCTGTAAGPLHPARGPRYGIAYGCEIHSGRVLDDTGRGGDFNVLQGINWAIAQGCEVISLSLGSPWIPGDPPYSPAYQAAAERALSAGCLLIIAAGNEAANPQYVGAVGTPGNSPSALTVAAIDENLNTAPFSDRVQTGAPGVKGPDLAAPGVNVYSAWPLADGQYNTISGTSMATPHVAGIAALFAQSNAAARGQSLKDLILRNCVALPNGAGRQGEVGRGLVQAP